MRKLAGTTPHPEGFVQKELPNNRILMALKMQHGFVHVSKEYEPSS